jgi:exopolyphosphatase/guanosine-5'-triphosphate,3'-diphosphate pyrophosphatase
MSRSPYSASRLPAQLRFSAIDIGSNAIRFLITDVFEIGARAFMKETTRVRVPLRLGREAFTTGRFSRATLDDLASTITAFSQLNKVYGVANSMACATSAVRTASNGDDLVYRIAKSSGVKIQVINGTQEADLVFSTYRMDPERRHGHVLFFDIGGGSTEVAWYDHGRRRVSESFNIGTVRLVERQVERHDWQALGDWLTQQGPPKRTPNMNGLGSGGNVKELFRIAHKKPGKALSLKRVETLRNQLAGYSLEERIQHMKMSRDRADVILPALQIIRFIMRSGRIKKLYCPRIGLLEGMIHRLYRFHLEENGGTHPQHFTWM